MWDQFTIFVMSVTMQITLKTSKMHIFSFIFQNSYTPSVDTISKATGKILILFFLSIHKFSPDFVP